MSIRVMSAVFGSTTLAPTERLILLSLADHADDNGRCYPSTSRLRQRTGLSERAVQSNLKKLAAQGYVTIVQNGGPKGVNLFLLFAAPSADAARQQVHPRGRRTPAADAPNPRSRCTRNRQ